MTFKKNARPSTADTVFPVSTNASNEMSRLKFELLQAESRLQKARNAVTSAEVDIRVLNQRIADLIGKPEA